MADNTRKTSNIIHDLDKVKEDVSNNSQDITNLSQNLTTLDGEAVKKINGVAPNSDGKITLVEGDNIDIVENTTNSNLTIKANLSEYTPTANLPAVNDKAINLSASKGVKVTQNGNTTGNNQSDKEWKLEANYTEIKDNINLALNDLSDVNSSAANTSEVVTYNTSTKKWSPSGGGNVVLGTPPPGGWIEGTVGDAIASGGGNVTGGVTELNGEEGAINITSANQTLNVVVDNSANPTTINLELNGTPPSVPSNIVETINNLDGNLTLQSSDSTIGIAANGTDKINLTLNASLDDLNNVSTGTPSDNQVLTWDGSNWTSQNASGGTFKTINDTIPDASGNFNIINGTGINATAGTNNLTLDCTVKNTDTGILTLTDGTSTVPTSGRSVEFTSSDASVQYTLDGNKIDLTVPAAGLNIKGSVQYAEPQTEADGTYTDGDGNAHEVLWLPSQYLEAASGVDNPALGDLWIVQYEGSAADGPPPGTSPYGHGYVFSLKGDNSGDYEWVDAGRLQGPPGEDGTSISLEEDVTVNSNDTILTSTGKFETTANPGEYALTLNIAPSDVTVGNLSELTDVCDTDPTYKQVLAWDNANSTWCPANATADAALPISSTDATVTLTSLAQKSFSVQVGDQGNLSSQLTVDAVAVRINQGSGASAIIVTADAGQPNNWIRFNGSDAPGFFGYEQATEKFRILSDAGTESAFEFETNTGNLNVTGQVQTDTITTKDAAKKSDTTPADPVIDLSWSTLNESVSSPAIAFRAGYYDNKESVVMQQGDGVAPNTANRMNFGQIVSVANNEIGTADDPAFAGMTFRHTYPSGSTGTIGVRQTYVGENASPKAEFAFFVRNANANLEVLTVNDQDIRAKSGYEPQTDDSLVTKGWVTNTDGGIGTLPISDNRDPVTVKLDSPSANTFTVSTGGEERVAVDSAGHVGINKSSPRTNTMLEVVSDTTSPFGLILDCQEAAGVYEGRSGIRQYGASANEAFEYCIDTTNGTYMFSGGSNARSAIINGDANADILVKPGEYVRLTPAVRTSSIVGSAAPDTDASISLGENLTVSTGGSESFKIAANKDATFQGHVGVMSPAYSTGIVSLQGELKPVNAGGAFGVWASPTYVVDPDAAYAQHARAFAGMTTPANGQAFDTFTQFYASAICGNTVGTNFGVYVSAIGAINNVGCCVTAGGSVQAGNWGFYDNTGYKSYLQGGLETPTVSGIVDNDASIQLNANCTVSAGGAARLYVRADGNIGHGYYGQSNINFVTYLGFGESTVEEFGFMAASKFDSQPSTSMVAFESQPEFGEGIKATNLAHFRANDGRSTNKPLDVIQRGFITSGLTLSTVGNRGFEANENIEVGKANYAFVAGGTAPSLFNGDVQVNKIVGAAAPDTNASIEFGAELLTNNHNPTQPNSIATRQYVDDQSGSAGLIDFGTPTDDTTPDSPNGTSLHDDMFLYVKGTTSWRKSALYPLDSTGGGSDFPIPQPGLDAGLEWIGYDIPVAAGSSGSSATVAAVGNAFFMLNLWSLNGTDWYSTSWADAQKLVVSPGSLTASYGQNVFCGADGYSYDGRNWTNYTLSSEPERISNSGGSFFYQGKHYARGGSHYFNGESWLSTGMTGSSMNDDSNYVIPCDACCVGISLTRNANLQIYTTGDMSDGVARWVFATEYGTVNPVGQGFLCVARNAATDICVALTNEHAWVQKDSGSTSFRKIALPVSAAWGGITHDGNNFIAVAEGVNSNISIRSDDGLNWEQSTTLDNPGVTSMAGFNGRAITSGVLPGMGNPRVASILVSGNPTPNFRSLEFEGKKLTSQMQTNEFLMQEISRLQKLIEEKCDS